MSLPTVVENTLRSLGALARGGINNWSRKSSRDFVLDALQILHAEFAHLQGQLRHLGEGYANEVGAWKKRASDAQDKLDAPIPMRLTCPECKALHIDEGEFATKPHATHSCQTCGLTWRPAVVCTVGVRFLPGFKNEPSKEATP